VWIGRKEKREEKCYGVLTGRMREESITIPER
jgi:hypothetical protein